MKLNSLLAYLAIAACLTLLTGCETSSSKSETITADIEVFRDGTTPTRTYKTIANLHDDGKEVEQEEIEAKMIKKAKKMKADAIIFAKPNQSGAEAEFLSFGGSKFTFLYKAAVVVYQ